LIPTEITNAVPNERDPIGTFFSFYRESNDPNAITLNNVLLAVYEPAHSGGHPFTLGGFESKGAQNIIGDSPLEIKMQKLGPDNAIFPAILFTLVTNTGVKTLCLPETTLTGENPSSYFYDNNGVPYFDNDLTLPAMNKSCSELLAKSYAPTEFLNISDEVWGPGLQFNLPYPDNLADQFNINFVRDNEVMMNYVKNSEIDSFVRPEEELNLIEGGKSPLALNIIYVDSTASTLTVPGRALTINSNLGTHTLCFPETKLTGEWDEGQQSYLGHVAYYYDINGTPYFDLFLTQRATDKPCNEILARGYKPTSIMGGILNKKYPPQTPANFQIYAIRPYSTLGVWQNDYNTFTLLPNNIAISNSPLVLSFGQAGENPDDPILLPERTLTLTSNLGTHTLCIPVINLPAGGHTFYAYDNQGNPYSDGLFQNKVNCTIPSKFSNPYRPTY
jgi:hypothetical protein